MTNDYRPQQDGNVSILTHFRLMPVSGLVQTIALVFRITLFSLFLNLFYQKGTEAKEVSPTKDREEECCGVHLMVCYYRSFTHLFSFIFCFNGRNILG